MKKAFLAVLAATALVSCSDRATDNEVLDNENVEIMLRSNTIDVSSGMTRVPFEGAIGTGNKLAARVITSTAEDFTGNAYADGIMEFNGEVVGYKTLNTGTTTFPNDDAAAVYLYGLYPAIGWEKGANNGIQTFTFTGKEDVMATNRIETEKRDVVSAKYKTLSFKHLLTKLEVKMYGSSLANQVFGQINHIRLVAAESGTGTIPNEIKVDNTNATYTTPVAVTPVTSAATSLDFYTLSIDGDGKKVYSDNSITPFALSAVPTIVGYSLIAPVDANNTTGSKEYFLEIVTADGGTHRVGVDLMAKGGSSPFNGSTQGRSFSISVNFRSAGNIMATAEVTDWVEEGESTGEVIKE